MRGLQKAVNAIKKAGKIAIAGHINPDGDCIGSLLSLGIGLEKLKKKVYMVSNDGVPKKYRILPGARRVRKRLDEEVDLSITVDCSTREMIGDIFGDLRKAGTLLEIDHHETRESFGDISLIDPKATAVGEQVFHLLRHMRVDINKDIAQNILTSLVVETNSFRLPNVQAATFEICSELLKTGVDFYRLVDLVYWSHSRQDAVLSGICLSRCKFLNRGRLAWSIIRHKDFKKAGGRDENVDAVADAIRAIKGVEIAVFFREKDKDTLRVSLRSKRGINIARLAEGYGGGGHADVAGCYVQNNASAMRKLLERARSML